MIKLTMEQVRGMFDKTAFESGMEYLAQNRVRHVRYGTENGMSRMECRVQGDASYQVTIQEQPGGRQLPRLSDGFSQDLKLYQELECHACVLDEGQHVKNQSTRFFYFTSMSKNAIICKVLDLQVENY